MNKKILFVEPQGAKVNVFANLMGHPLLGPLYMATILKEFGYDVTVIKENLVDKFKFTEYLKKADILILTIMTVTSSRGYEISRIYKSFRPDGRVIGGGIHVSLNPDEALQYFDQIAIGEGPLIIKDLIEGKITDKIVHGSPVEDLNTLPIPDLSLLVNNHKLIAVPVMTSLGCPFGCTFCCVTRVYGRRYRYQSPDKTIEEIRHHIAYLKKKSIFFYDDNFCANKKNSLEFFDKIRDQGLKFNWRCQVRADLAKDEAFIQRMSEAGCNRVYIGFESINDATLNGFNKSSSAAEVSQALDIFHKYGIAVHGMFILGSDADGPEVFDMTADFCVKKGIDSAQFLAITPFPGTEFSNSLNPSQLIYKDTDELDGFHINIAHKSMTSHELMKGILYLHDTVSSWKNIFRILGRNLQFIFQKNHLPLHRKLFNAIDNFLRNTALHIIIGKWKKSHADYHTELKKLHYESKIEQRVEASVSFDNLHTKSEQADM